MRKIWTACLLIPALFFLSCAGLVRMTEEDVIELSRAEVGDAVIVRHIETSGAVFDLSSEDVLKLKAAGVSEKVIRKMLQTRMVYRRTWGEYDRHPVCRWAYADSTLTREDVLKMVRSGVGDGVIARQIEAKGRFDLTADEIVRLSEAGVSDQVIEAMVESGDRKPPESMYHIHHDPYPPTPQYYDWYWRPYLWRSHYRPYYEHGLSIAHPSYKYYRYGRRWW